MILKEQLTSRITVIPQDNDSLWASPENTWNQID